MIKVGSKIKLDSEPVYKYPMLIYDFDGWADASKYLPLDFDLVWIKVEGFRKEIRAWFTGQCWDGIRYSKKSRVLFWKRDKNEQ